MAESDADFRRRMDSRMYASLAAENAAKATTTIPPTVPQRVSDMTPDQFAEALKKSSSYHQAGEACYWLLTTGLKVAAVLAGLALLGFGILLLVSR